MSAAAEGRLTGWVLKPLYCQKKGISDGQVRGKTQRGVWQKGVHYVVKDRRTWLHVENIEQWLTSGNTQQACGLETAAASKSAGKSAARRTLSSSPKPPRLLR